MTAPVDVLAVMDWMHAASNRDRREMPLDRFAEADAQMEAQEIEARAAVAELIAAVDGMFDSSKIVTLKVHVYNPIDRLRDAVARCKGDAQ